MTLYAINNPLTEQAAAPKAIPTKGASPRHAAALPQITTTTTTEGRY